MKKVLVIGSSNIDYAVSIDNFPHAGETVIANYLDINFGGKGANQAVALARSGIQTSFITGLGQDQHGQDFLKHLKNESIDVSETLIYPNHTGQAFISIDHNAENQIVVYPGSNYEIEINDIQKKEDYILQFDICLLQLELPIETVKKCLDICHRNDVTVVLNPAPYHESMNSKDLDKVDYFIPNEHEFESFFKKTADAKMNLNTKVIVTQGKKGSLYLNEMHQQEAIPVKAVDTTAAGDTYVGYFVAALARNWPIKKAMQYASFASALTVQKKGAQKSIPYHDDVVEFIKVNK